MATSRKVTDPIEAQLTLQQRTALQKNIAATVEHRDTWIMRYRADLSTDPRLPAQH